jgi:DNA-binding transcriptional LysR family regulator
MSAAKSPSPAFPSAVRYFLPAILKAYHERYPQILVRVIDQGANEVLSTCCATRPTSA